MRITGGTVLYQIPLKDGYQLKKDYPLIILERFYKVTVECPAFADYGQGDTFDEALHDLGSSIIDFWNSLKEKSPEVLSDDLRRILAEMNLAIKEEVLDVHRLG